MPAEEIFYDIATQRLTEQMARVDSLDAKVATAFGFENGILAIFGASFSLAKLPDNLWVKVIFLAFGVLGALLYVMGLRYSYRAYQVRSYSFRPNPRDLQEYSANHSAEDTRRALAEQCVLSIEANEEWLNKKAKYLYSALAVLPMQAGALTIATVIALFAR